MAQVCEDSVFPTVEQVQNHSDSDVATMFT